MLKMLGINRLLAINAIMAAIIIIATLYITFKTLGSFRESSLEATGKILDSMLTHNQQVSSLWLHERMDEIRFMISNDRFLELTEKLLAAPRSQAELLTNPALVELRAYFAPYMDFHKGAGIFIIAPDMVNIASMRDANVGKTNLIALQRKDLLARAFDGKPVFVPPIVSDVALPNVKGESAEHEPTIFVAAPIYGGGKVIAVFTLRLDIHDEFSKNVTLGSYGETGQMFLFDKSARLMSVTRFAPKLAEMGILGRGESGVLVLELRDPGGDLLNGFQPRVARERLPYTKLAMQAMKAPSGKILEPYRNHLGQFVLGAWKWDESLDLITAIEITEQEALTPYFMSRRIVVAALAGGAALLLVFFFTLYRTARRGVLNLEDAEKRIRYILDNTSAVIFIKDLQGRYVFINKSYEYDHKKRRDEEVHGKTDWDIHSPDLARMLRDNDNKVIESGQPMVFEETVRTTRGERAFITNKFPLFDQRGVITGICGVATDVTDLRRYEETLRKSEEKFRQIVESSSDWVWEVDAEGRYTYASPRVKDILGYNPEEVIGKTPFDLMPPAEARRIGAIFEVIVKSRQPFHLLENINTRADGSEVVLETSGVPYFSPGGELLGYRGVDRDVTERKKSEKALTASFTQAELLITSIASILISVDENDTVLRWNDAAQSIFGIPPREAIGRRFTQLPVLWELERDTRRHIPMP